MIRGQRFGKLAANPFDLLMQWRAFLAILVLSLPPAPAFAQGTGGLLPDPISTADLIEWFEELSATADQRAAILALHDEYLAKCRELRDGRMQELLDRDREIYATGQPSILIARDDLASFLREREAAAAALATLDRALLAQARELLDADAQQPILESIAIERECARLAANKLLQPWFSRVQRLDFDEAFQQAGLTEEEIASLEAEMTAHHRALAPALSRLAQMVDRQLVAYVENLAARGYARNPAVPALEDYAEREPLLAAWWEELEPVRPAVKDVIRVQVETAGRIARSLPFQSATRFRITLPYLMRAVALDSNMTRGSTILEESLQNPELTDEERNQILAIYAEWSANWGAIIDQSARDAVEDSAGETYWAGEPMHTPEWRAKITERAERQFAQFDAANAAALEGLRAIIGTEPADAIAAAVKARSEAQRQERRENPDTILEMVNLSHAAYLFLPPQVTKADINRFIELAGLDEPGAEAVREAHDRYLAALREFSATGFDAMRADPVDIRIDEVARQGLPPTLAELERGEKARDAVIQQLRELEEQFIADVEARVRIEAGEEALALQRLHRGYRAEAEYLGSWMDVTHWGYSERCANLVEVVEDADISAASRARAREHLLLHSDAINAAVVAHYEAHKAHVHEGWVQQRTWHDIREAGTPTDEQVVIWEEGGWKDSKAAAAARLREARTGLIDVNRRIVTEIAAAIHEISQTDAEMLRRAYRREAYPAVYADPTFTGALLERALTLDDLTVPQSRELISTLVELENRYEAHSIEICSVFSDSRFQAIQGGTEEDWKDRALRQEMIEKLKFFRREVCDRARVDLMDILTPEQWTALARTTGERAVPN